MWSANLVLGMGALFLLVRAARESPISLPFLPHFLRAAVERSSRPRPEQAVRRPVVVVRIPRLSLPFPNIMDRYIAREFTRYFSLILASLVVVYVLGLLIDVIADAFQYRVKGILVLQYLLSEQPQILFYMLPLATLMATLVTFAIFTKTSELTAAKAGGMSLYRLSVPVVLMGVAVSGACFALQEYLLPYANRRAAELRDEIKRQPVKTYNVLDRRWMMGRENQIYNYAFYDPGAKRFSGLAVYRYSKEPFGLTERLYAHEAEWDPSEGAWRFENGWRRNFKEGAKVESFAALSVPGIEPPSYFLKEERSAEQMTYLELSRYLSDLKQAGFDVVRLEVALQSKFSFPLAAAVTVLIAIPFSFSTGKKGALYGIGIAIAIGLSYYVTTRLFAFMGQSAMLPPEIAAWAPNALFSLGALYGLFNVKT
jgi:LPS export ABC transporter permease LptG